MPSWVKGEDAKGQPRRDPDKDPSIGGLALGLAAHGEWQQINRGEPPAYSPDTGLFYIVERNVFSIFYLTDPDPRGSMGLGGKEEVLVGPAWLVSDRDRSEDGEDRLAPRTSQPQRRWQWRRWRPAGDRRRAGVGSDSA